MAKVLLVEDDNNLREIYEARLQAEGYETATASDGEQALVVAKEAKPDLVISDVMMPKISGFEMLDILRNTDGLKDVKVIMLTALGQSEDKARADQLGADKYLVKSQVTLEDIVKTAHQLLDDAPAPEAAAAAAPAAPAPTATVPEPAAPAATATPEPATTDEETKAMQAQIDSFAAQPAVDTPAVEPAAPAAAAPEPVVATPAPVASDDAAATAHDDQVMASAVDSLADAADAQRPSEVTAVEVAPPAEADAPGTPPAAAEADVVASDEDDVTPSHKKVIKPLDDGGAPKPDINQLLAAEQAAATANEPVPTAPAASEVTPAPPLDITEPPADPNKPNPNEIAL